MRELPKYMLRTDKGHNTIAISQSCLPDKFDVALGSIAGMSEQITYTSFEEMEKITKDIALAFGVSSRGTGEQKDEKKMITEIDITIMPIKLVDSIYIPITIEKGIVSTDIGLKPEEFLSKRFAMERYIGMIDGEKEKDTLVSNYDRAMKFVV